MQERELKSAFCLITEAVRR